ncbi:MAG: hypothetical protein H7Y59_06125 [Anaerolineales bacterium]|nr:hypothetical protein [Anaerolineales bacterium]
MQIRIKRKKENDLKKKSIARALFYLNAILWVIYTIYIYFDMAVVNNNERSADIVTIYVLVNAITMFISGLVLGKQKKPAFYFPLVIVVFNIILTMLDLADLVFLVAFILDVIILWLLISIRNIYLSES